MNQKKIGICGCHGAGKTTKAKELSDRFTGDGKTVLVVDEVARSCPHTLGTIEAQEWIWAEQMRREKHAMAQDVDVIICDRTVMGNLMYYYDILYTTHRMRPFLREWHRWDALYCEAKEWMPTYDQVIRLPLNLEWLQAEDPIRSKDVVCALKVDVLFDMFVQPYVTDYAE